TMPARCSDRDRLAGIDSRDLAIARIERLSHRAGDLPVGRRQPQRPIERQRVLERAPDLIEQSAQRSKSQLVAAGLDRPRWSELDPLAIKVVQGTRAATGQADRADDLALPSDRHDDAGQDSARPAPKRPGAGAGSPATRQRAAWRIRKFTNRGWMQWGHAIPRVDYVGAAVLPRQPGQVRGRWLEQR